MIDVNDNPPVFTSRLYSRKMTEGVEEGTIVATVVARDVDKGKNADVRYRILDGNQEGEKTDPISKDGDTLLTVKNAYEICQRNNKYFRKCTYVLFNLFSS